MSENVLWQGESKSLTSAATGGKVVSKRYKITDQYIYVESGVISSSAQQYPLWAVRDVDIKSTVIQKARGLSSVTVRVEANDYTGAQNVVLENVEDGQTIRSLVNKHANDARLLRQQQAQAVHYSGTHPVAALPVGNAVADPIEQLSKLGALLQAGLLTQEEFDAQKAKLLA